MSDSMYFISYIIDCFNIVYTIYEIMIGPQSIVYIIHDIANSKYYIVYCICYIVFCIYYIARVLSN